MLTPTAAVPRSRPSLGLRAVMACVRDEEQTEHGGRFSVVRDTLRPWSPHRPLVIVVHPGDAVESPFGWRPDDRPRVLNASRTSQVGMAQELAQARHDRADTVVLHRRSSDLVLRDQDAAWQNDAYRHEVQQLGRSGALLYGDDLDTAAQWIAQNVPLNDRPSVLLTGAYCDRDHGCVTAIGQALQQRFPHLTMTLSPFSMSSSINDGVRWVPLPPQPRSPLDSDPVGPRPQTPPTPFNVPARSSGDAPAAPSGLPAPSLHRRPR